MSAKSRLGQTLPFVIVVLLALFGGMGVFEVGAQGGLQPPQWVLSGAPTAVVSTETKEYAPAVAYNSVNNEFIVVYEEEIQVQDRPPLQHTNVKARLFKANGAVIDIPVAMGNANNREYQRRPAVAYNSVANEYLVVWLHTIGSTPNSADVRIARLSGENGTVITTRSMPTAAGTQLDTPRVAFSPVNARNGTQHVYLVVWAEGVAAYGIKGQFIDGQGNPLPGDALNIGFPVDALAGGQGRSCADQLQPDIAWSDETANTFLVVWSKWTNGGSTGQPGQCEVDLNYKIWGRRVGGGGVPASDPFVIAELRAQHQEWPAVAYNTVTRKWLVTWVDTRTVPFSLFGDTVAINGANGLLDVQVPNSNTKRVRPALVFAEHARQFFLGWYTAAVPARYAGLGWTGEGEPSTQAFTIWEGQASDLDVQLGYGAAMDGPALLYDAMTQQVRAFWTANVVGTPNYNIWTRLATHVPPTATPTATVTPTSTPSGPPFVQVEGFVFDCDGAPIPNAEVIVVGTTLRAFTNVSGFYRTGQLPSIPAQDYTISATAAGRATVTEVRRLQAQHAAFEVNFTGNKCLGPAPTATATPPPTNTPTATATATATATRTPVPVYKLYMPHLEKAVPPRQP